MAMMKNGQGRLRWRSHGVKPAILWQEKGKFIATEPAISEPSGRTTKLTHPAHET